jgi:hypothetical protein
MNWVQQDVFYKLVEEDGESNEEYEIFTYEVEDMDDEDGSDSGSVVYTIHKHPAFISIAALYLNIQENIEELLAKFPGHISHIQVWNIAQVLKDGQLQNLLAISSKG